MTSCTFYALFNSIKISPQGVDQYNQRQQEEYCR